MAPLARFTQLPLMLVVFLMTGRTFDGDFITFLSVAFGAGHRNMFSGKRIFCRGMVEPDLFPFFNNQVAPVARLTQISFMLVLFFVAADARFWGLLQPGILMALDAVNFLMESDESEIELIMVENRLFPGLGRMARLALFA
jgi:hypothetical protein